MILFPTNQGVDMAIWLFRIDLPLPEGFAPLDDADRQSSLRPDKRRMARFSAFMRRRIWAEILGVPPSTLTFRTGRYGKPYLAGRSDAGFSVSHSGLYWAMAVLPRDWIGLDLEEHKPRRLLASMAKYYFGVEESEERFYRLWTRNEAYTKYRGTGLRYDVASQPIPPPHVGVFTAILPEFALTLSVALASRAENVTARLPGNLLEGEVLNFYR
jgi:phosphopantetheinyl transferase